MLEKVVSETAIPESELPSLSLPTDVKTGKKASGTGPYPEFVRVFGDFVREGYENPLGLRVMLKFRVAVALCKLLCFLRIHGVEGLERWIT